MTPEQNNPFEPEKAPDTSGPVLPAPIRLPMKELYDQWAGATAPESTGPAGPEPEKTAASQKLEELTRKRAQGHAVDQSRLRELSEIVDEERANSEER